MNVSDYVKKDPTVKVDIEAINSVFNIYGLKVDEVVASAQVLRYKVKLPLDIKIQGKIRRAAKDIEYTLQSALNDNSVVYGKDGDSLFVERKKDFEVIKFEDVYKSLPANGLYLFLGRDMNGKNCFTNLEKAPHILVAGTTGSGKSELLHTFIASLFCHTTELPIAVTVIDPKRAEYADYKGKEGIDIITDMNIAVNVLKSACDLMESRYAMLEQKGYKDVSQLKDISRQIIIIDEIADLLMQYHEAEKYIIRLAQKARACGIHLILGTQSPRRDVITGLIKANVPTKIALKCSTQTESRIIFDHGGAETLMGKGDMLFLANGSFTPLRIQAPYVTPEFKKLLVSYMAPKEPTQPQTVTNTYTPTYYKKPAGLLHGLAALYKIKPVVIKSNEYPINITPNS